jgi:nitrogen fixation protein NifU and related proteins
MFTERVLDHVQRQRNVGPLENAQMGEAGLEGDGPFIKIWVQLEGETVSRAAYRTYGCPACIACASQLVELIIGRDQKKIVSLEPTDLILLLGGLPEGKEHCPQMAVQALRAALENSRSPS